jgi:hypothetical protein
MNVSPFFNLQSARGIVSVSVDAARRLKIEEGTDVHSVADPPSSARGIVSVSVDAARSRRRVRVGLGRLAEVGVIEGGIARRALRRSVSSSFIKREDHRT